MGLAPNRTLIDELISENAGAALAAEWLQKIQDGICRWTLCHMMPTLDVMIIFHF
jgi:hypothetical protein